MDESFRRLGVVQLVQGADRTVLRRLTDTDVTFPHPTLSLTHTGDRAYAVRTEGTAGVGIDAEGWRQVDPRMARFFLSDADARPYDLLRLWTVKEAVFKATSENHSLVLTDFIVLDATRAVGPRGERYEYATTDLPTGPLTVAVRKESP